MKPNKDPRNQVMIKSFVVNAGLIILKALGGIFFASTALIADAIHSLSDFLSDTLVLIGLKHSNNPPDEEHPFGHGKIEYVLSLLLGVGILFIAYQLITHVIGTLRETPTAPSLHAVYVAIGVIVIKVLLARYILVKAKRLDSQVLKASASESYSDALGSAVVVLGIGLGVLGAAFNIPALLYGDALAALVIVIFIVRIAFMIIADAIRSILGKSASKPILDETRAVCESVGGVRQVDKLRMIVYGHYYQVMVDIRVDGNITVKEGHDIASAVKKKLKKSKKIGHVIVHVNPEV